MYKTPYLKAPKQFKHRKRNSNIIDWPGLNMFINNMILSCIKSNIVYDHDIDDKLD